MAAQQVERIESSLQIEEDIDSQEKGWKVQAVGTYMILALTILSGLGLFGYGPLSPKTVRKDGVVVEYEKFLHLKGSTQMAVSISNVDSVTVISLPLHYLEYFEIQTIVPEPVENRITGQHIEYTFKTNQTGRVAFTLSPFGWGGFAGDIKVNGTSLPLSHYTYP